MLLENSWSYFEFSCGDSSSLSPSEDEKWSFTFYYLEEQEVNFCSAVLPKLKVISSFVYFLHAVASATFMTHDFIKFRIFDQCNMR